MQKVDKCYGLPLFVFGKWSLYWH